MILYNLTAYLNLDKYFKNDAIIGKVAPIQMYTDKSRNKYKDKSIIYKDNYKCKVDNIQNTTNSEGYYLSKVKLRHLRCSLLVINTQADTVKNPLVVLSLIKQN